MERISRDFVREEFECHCGCGFDTVDIELISIVQDIRDMFERPIVITSGCRCKKYNERIGGSENSQHTIGRAADLYVASEHITPKDVYNYLCEKYSDEYGFGLYDSFVHVDSRNEKARWKG